MSKEYDPTMHTAEHVLNQTMVRMFGTARSFSAHLNRGKSKCDYKFSRDLTNDEALALEKEINLILEANLPVTEEMVTLAQAADLVNISKLPPEAKDGPSGLIRLVRIGDYDLCPCIGAHLTSTGLAHPFRLISHSLLENEVLRLRFKAGPA